MHKTNKHIGAIMPLDLLTLLPYRATLYSISDSIKAPETDHYAPQPEQKKRDEQVTLDVANTQIQRQS